MLIVIGYYTDSDTVVTVHRHESNIKLVLSLLSKWFVFEIDSLFAVTHSHTHTHTHTHSLTHSLTHTLTHARTHARTHTHTHLRQ